MRGLMMDFPLAIPALLRRAAQLGGSRELVSRWPDRSITRSTHAEFARRSYALAVGAVVARAAQGRSRRHAVLEPPSAPGGLLRDPARRWRLAHAEPAPPPGRSRLHRQPRRGSHPHRRRQPAAAVREVPRPRASRTRHRDRRRREPARGVPRLRARRRQRRCVDRAVLPDLDENDAAAMCYTSGTTGRPKGVRVLASVDRAALPEAPRSAACWACPSRRLPPAGRADVPRERVGHAVHRRHGRREDGVPGAAPGPPRGYLEQLREAVGSCAAPEHRRP